MNRAVLGILGCIILILQCSLRVAGVETTNGKIAVAMLADGSRASGARVTVVAFGDWYAKRTANTAVIVDTAVADHNGVITFKQSWPSPIALQIAADSQGLYAPIVTTTADSRVDTFVLGRYGSISGRVPPNASSMVFLAGASFESPVDIATGSFNFASVPPGTFAVLVPKEDSAGTLHLEFAAKADVLPDANVQLGAIAPTDSLLLSDFDASSFACGLAPITSGGFWYSFDDAELGGISSASMVFDSGFTGQSIRCDAILRESAPNTTYSGIGLFLGDHTDSTLQYYNLSHLKAITFMAKGKGPLSMDFFTKLTPDGQRFSATVQLGPSWQKYVVPVDSLVLTGSPYTWAQVSDRVNIMDFVILAPADSTLPDTVSVWLDDVHFIGLTADELMDRQ